jgi:hypothetical protein
MQSADVELLRSLVGDGPTDAALAELLARCDGDPSVAANRWFDSMTPPEASASAAPLAAPPPVSSSATEWPRILGQLEMLAFSVVQQHELDGPLLPGEALELQVGSGRRKAAGASSGKRRALGADEPQPLRFCARGVTVGRVPTSAAKRRPKLTRSPRGLRTVRTGDAYLQAICVPYTPERRAACPGGDTHCTRARVPAPYVPRTVGG